MNRLYNTMGKNVKTDNLCIYNIVKLKNIKKVTLKRSNKKSVIYFIILVSKY